ncbi:hypothetical protein BGZ96_002500, partial [Linnemannia gamsii]
MEETQSFRLIGKSYIEKIATDHFGGQSVVFWEDIEQVFPGAKHVKNGDVSINMLRDSSRNRIMPLCIKHCPGVVLDVVLYTTVEYVHVDYPMASSRLTLASGRTDSLTKVLVRPLADPLAITSTSSSSPSIDALTDSPNLNETEDKCVEALQVSPARAKATNRDIHANSVLTSLPTSPLRSRSHLQVASKSSSSLKDTVKLASKEPQESDSQVRLQELNVKISHMIELQETLDVKQEEMKQLQRHSISQQEEMKLLQKQVLEHQDEMKLLQLQVLEHQEEMKQLQIQALGQFKLLISQEPNLTGLSLYKNMGWSLALSEALKTNSTLTTLSLHYNWIMEIGAVALSETLNTNSTLTTLSLHYNSIGENGAVALFEVLKFNSTLTTLNLERNCIEDNGAVALSEALKVNSTLTTLNLERNCIEDNGA